MTLRPKQLTVFSLCFLWCLFGAIFWLSKTNTGLREFVSPLSAGIFALIAFMIGLLVGAWIRSDDDETEDPGWRHKAKHRNVSEPCYKIGEGKGSTEASKGNEGKKPR